MVCYSFSIANGQGQVNQNLPVVPLGVPGQLGFCHHTNLLSFTLGGIPLAGSQCRTLGVTLAENLLDTVDFANQKVVHIQLL